MDALLTTVTEHDVKVRILLEPSAFNGFENRIGISWFLGEVAEAGMLDNVEIKWFDGKMHDKAFLVDGEFLVVGSQNFHYSAWGSPSLTEYNISTEDSDAIADFLSEFEFQWDQGTPVEE
jgi:cardiolipin synthase